MPFEYTTLLVAAIFSSSAIAFTLLTNWIGMRKERSLILSSIGLILLSLALALMSMRNGRYDTLTLSVPFSLLLVGLSFIHASIRVFLRKTNLWPSVILAASTIVLSITPYFIGLMGLGGIIINVTTALILALCAFEYFAARTDSRLTVLTVGSLYLLIAVSYLTTAGLLVMEGEWILYPVEDRWYDSANAIITLLGITGIGALTVTLQFSRASKSDLKAARTDPLTGVFNRRALFERFDAETAIPGQAVLVFDLDHFKQVNDRLGHAGGDSVLRGFGEILQQHFGDDAMIARIGGEEFCVVVDEHNSRQAGEMAEDLRLGFASLNLPGGRDGSAATVSIGLATAGPDESFESVLSRADAALYKAKRGGRNTVRMASVRAA